MIGRRIVLKRGSRDDGEKPFWISFADLMTALMVLFLVALSAALMTAQKETEAAIKLSTFISFGGAGITASPFNLPDNEESAGSSCRIHS